jgi:pilus assembly protein CpaF
MFQEIFTFQRDGVDAEGMINGRFVATGIRPRFGDRLKSSSYDIDPKVFEFLG